MPLFPKNEKLCGKLRIAALYKEGRRFVSFPVRVTHKAIMDSDAAPVVLIWAPKSIFKHAVDRNLCRRLMREAYRLEKQPLADWCTEHHCSLQLALNYIDKEIRSQEEIRRATRKAIEKIIQQENKELANRA